MLKVWPGQYRKDNCLIVLVKLPNFEVLPQLLDKSKYDRAIKIDNACY